MRQLCIALAGLGGLGLVVATGLTLLDVAFRYRGTPIDWLAEAAILVVTGSVAAFFPLTLQADHNLSIRYLGAAVGRRTKRALDLFGAVATLVFFGIMAWRFALYAADALRSGETTAMSALPIYPVWIVVAVIFLVALPVQVWFIWRFLVGQGGRDGDAAQ
jgi:TRAP-type C4-dicarboxylate transport system permease small subunit